ncbi:Uu.00g138260.m01.CDS01 [Anthostomella pinea]|uniref:Uu.00g138260.m01.CDS01 n=1 Tax=Anthostomella pinea TaxID=933095 RepID=A0AAI8VJ88_9PEZI|nr:Uu.00g138260.m01.CDS01 [Anthostomella pinea]
MPALKIRMWHFPKSIMTKLKDESTAKTGDTWISTYGATMGVLWKTITRAKLPLLNPDLDTKTILAHGLNTRAKMQPPLTDNFMGNAVALPRTEPRAIRDILADGNLTEMAAAVRWPHPQFEGYCFILPSRAGMEAEGSDEGLEVIVCLEESCHDRLFQDEELQRYAQPRGFDA